MAVQWSEADESDRISDDESRVVIEHLARHGALGEAAAVMEAIEAGTDDAPIVAPDEARRRLRALIDDG